MEKINLQQKFAQFSDYWNPRIIGELNGQYVKIAKFNDAFVWHTHEQEDELFLVVQGKLLMEFRDRTVEVGPGEILIVPRGIEHRPQVEEETHVVMFEPKSTVNTGALENELTRKDLEVL